jgi:hypothetical protein
MGASSMIENKRHTSPTPLRASKGESESRTTSPKGNLDNLDRGSYMRIKLSLADLIASVERLEQTFAPGIESEELTIIKAELNDPERYRANWENAVHLLDKHMGKIQKQGVKLQQLLQFSFDRLDDLEISVEDRNKVH